MTKIALSEPDLLKVANDELKKFPGYIEGMEVLEARMEKHILVLRGECFFDAENNLTEDSVVALQVYQNFGNEFAEKYTLAV